MPRLSGVALGTASSSPRAPAASASWEVPPGAIGQPPGNDLLAATIGENLSRFTGFAALAPQGPPAAAKEREGVVTQLGLCGGLANARTEGHHREADREKLVHTNAERLFRL